MSISKKDKNRAFRFVLPAFVIILVMAIMIVYTNVQRKNVVRNAEHVTNQMAEYMANNIANEVDYAKSSIKLAANMIAQTMTSDTVENPSEIIAPMVANTPFGAIEYIRADGMNVMNVGEPFDASDREYYIEGIKGNTGIWNNYHPKISQETLVNCYTPLLYQGEICGVITGYINATSQIASLFETELYGQPIQGILLDEDNMVICSTFAQEYVKDLSLDMLLERQLTSDVQRQKLKETIARASTDAATYKNPNGEGRICVTLVPNMNWKVAILVPETSFHTIIRENITQAVIAIIAIGVILISYAAFVLLRNVRRRKLLSVANAKLEAQNRDASATILEIRDIIASANMGIWKIEMVEGAPPRMYADATMRKLLGLADSISSPEDVYASWYDNIKPEALDSVLQSVERMKQGCFDENTYQWAHPTKGFRYVRCGGTAKEIPGGILLRGYHYDVDEAVRKEISQMMELQDALHAKMEYYETLGSISEIYYSMHVIDLQKDTVVEFTARNEVKEIVNHMQGAREMMQRVMQATTYEKYREEALAFTDLSTLAERMKDKKIITKQLFGNRMGWFLSSFITMETDASGRPTKVIYTTRVNDEEKRQEEKLIEKSQTDELTGLLNRRAYEEDIYAHNDIPSERNFVYVSLDVNGLKVVNDTLGHTAGDELIIGSCQCMRQSLGAYGRLYRTGGDEFVAILFCEAGKMKDILEDFDQTIENWSGQLIDSLSISYGWISKEEMPEASVRQLGAIAEQRMYEAKSEHYRRTGVDRRGQKDAHKVLCDLYTKILKINLSEDSYQIINMDEREQTEAMGFSPKISEWLSAFGRSGQVHPDDLAEYLKKTEIRYMEDYFAQGKTSLHIFYRRKCAEGFVQVMMEIVPANDYSVDSHSYFLYVKNIDQ